MDNLLITNKEEANKFKTLLDSYWMDNSSSSLYSEHIHNFYKEKSNLSFIDNEVNNNRACILAMSCSDNAFLELLFKSDELNHKRYAIDNLSLTLGKSSHISNECALLFIDNVENNPNIFAEYKLRSKRIFVKSCIEYFAQNMDFLDNNEEYFFKFLKKYKVNPFVQESPIASLLLENGRIKTFDNLIDQAQKDEDKERILFHTLLWTTNPTVEERVNDYLELKRKSFLAHKEYKALQLEIKHKDEVKQPKMVKV